jgi:hypothetical protein
VLYPLLRKGAVLRVCARRNTLVRIYGQGHVQANTLRVQVKRKPSQDRLNYAAWSFICCPNA